MTVLAFPRFWRKFRAVFSIYFQDGIAYRASAVIWLLTDLTTALTMPFIWIATSRSNGGMIGGFSISQMVDYYLGMLLLSTFITSHIMWEIAMEIKEGQFSTALLRPVSFYQFCFARSLSWRIIRPLLFFPMFLGLLWLFRDYLPGAVWNVSPALILSVILGHLVSFTFVMGMAMIAFFTQEVYSVFELYYIPMLLLSGSVFPVSILPHWAQLLSRFLPFYYTVGAPTEILVGRVTGVEIPRVLAGQLAWVILSYVVGRALWKVGLKQYSGVGM